jgi:formylglycine-generating enzyme required for sulfatase activity
MWNVTYEEAIAYARDRHARLCSEAEWERAARGADGRRFPHGQRLYPEDASYGETYGAAYRNERFHDEVGQFPRSASPFGVLDLVGGAQEWTNEVLTQDLGVTKGGSFTSVGEQVQSDSRIPSPLRGADVRVGVRLCMAQPVAR